MWQFTFYFLFYCPSSKPRAKMKFNGHSDNLIIMAALRPPDDFACEFKSPGYIWSLAKFMSWWHLTTDHVSPPEVSHPLIQSPGPRPLSLLCISLDCLQLASPQLDPASLLNFACWTFCNESCMKTILYDYIYNGLNGLCCKRWLERMCKLYVIYPETMEGT